MLAITLLVCISVSTTTRAVSPAPDGGYSNRNTAEGEDALFSLTSAFDNTAVGFQALHSDTQGGGNVANGSDALFSNTFGGGNTAVGLGAMYGNTTGSLNTAIGDSAGYGSNNGDQNTSAGAYSFFSGGGSSNTAIGTSALYYTTGSNNIALGNFAGYNLTSGSNNIDIGNQGVAGESNVTRVGTPGTQTAAYVAGIFGVDKSNGSPVFIDANGQLGTGSAEGIGANGVTLLSGFTISNLGGHKAVWIGAGSNWDATDGIAATNEPYALFFVSRMVTLTSFYARISGGTVNAGNSITFQVFDGSGVAVGSGSSATCVIPGGQSSAVNANASITLYPGIYAVKATSGSGNLPGKPAYWALGN